MLANNLNNLIAQFEGKKLRFQVNTDSYIHSNYYLGSWCGAIATLHRTGGSRLAQTCQIANHEQGRGVLSSPRPKPHT